MNNLQKKARPAQKHPVQTSWEKTTNTQNGLNKVEGILTSPIKLKELKNEAYFWAFFQLEGIPETDIPVIFKIKKNPFLTLPNIPISGYDKPEIPSRSKVLLIGSWSESLTSTRPSFTCTNYEILANPPPLTVKDLKDQISSLLSTSLEKQSEWKQRTDYLFRKKKDLEEIEKLTKLGEEYLSAYLLIRQPYYSNYQNNLLPHNRWNQEEYLAKLASEIEETAHQIRAYEAKNIF
jgi:hypothetical protein